jgi:hypothetical protein
MNTAATPAEALVQRDSGLIVPAHLAGVPEEPDADKRAQGSVDPDGKRRVVIPRPMRRSLSKLSGDLAVTDLAIVIVCKTFRMVTREVRDAASGEKVRVELREEIPGACGKIMLRCGEGTIDPGFECDCTRLHFLAGV